MHDVGAGGPPTVNSGWGTWLNTVDKAIEFELVAGSMQPMRSGAIAANEAANEVACATFSDLVDEVVLPRERRVSVSTSLLADQAVSRRSIWLPKPCFCARGARL